MKLLVAVEGVCVCVGGLQLVCGRPNLALSSVLVPHTLSCLVCVADE